jgi:DNA-binding NarL/FixJ family response regulator
MTPGATSRQPNGRGERIRVLLVDDQTLLRQGFQLLLELESSVEVVGAAADGQEAIELVEQLQRVGRPPQVVLMDVRMPRLDGVQATAHIRARWPGVRVMMLTTFDDEDVVVEGLRAGAQGYLLKDASAEELVAAIRAVHRGESPLQPSVAAKLVARLARAGDAGDAVPPRTRPSPPEAVGRSAGTADALPADELTEREREILRHVARGASNREIGEALFIAEGTVKNHVSNILSKLGLRDRTQAALWARERGLA